WEPEIRSLTFAFEVRAEDHTIRAEGKVNLPNGALITVALAKPQAIIARTETVVIDQHFEATFGPRITATYHFIGEVDVFTPDQYTLIAEFDPLRQPEKIRQWIGEYGEKIREVIGGQVLKPEGRQAPLVQVVKQIPWGSEQERQRAREIEAKNRQLIQTALGEAVKDLLVLQGELQEKYEQELASGGFSRSDRRGLAWIEWARDWEDRLAERLQKHRLTEEVAPFSPFAALRGKIVQAYTQLKQLKNRYLEVLLQEQDPQNPALLSLQTGIEALLHEAEETLNVTPPQPPPPTWVRITAEGVNIRNGPNTASEIIGRSNRGDRFEMLTVEGEWYQVKLPDGKRGWIHGSLLKKEEPSSTSPSPGRTPLRLQPLPPHARLADIPPPTEDEKRIYADIEQGLSAIPLDQFRQGDEIRVVEEVARKYRISKEAAWNAYLKVQGWQLKQ
ncbi:MAG: SH3 domain-containing protein, partial [Nitrospinota bacterium]